MSISSRSSPLLPQKGKKKTTEEGKEKRQQTLSQRELEERELILRCPHTVSFWDIVMHHAVLWLPYRL